MESSWTQRVFILWTMNKTRSGSDINNIHDEFSHLNYENANVFELE